LYGYSHPLKLANGAPRGLHDTMRRDTEAENVVVNGYAIGAGHSLPSSQQIDPERGRRRSKLLMESKCPGKNHAWNLSSWGNSVLPGPS
jgi:hypothetical protein